MKTPRELILSRHRAADAKLKAIDAARLAEYARDAAAAPPPGRTSSLAALVAAFWLEAIRPWRRAWLGVAAAWIILLTFALGSAGGPAPARVARPRLDAAAKALLQEQKRMMAQLLEPAEAPPAPVARPTSPRSDRQPSLLNVQHSTRNYYA